MSEDLNNSSRPQSEAFAEDLSADSCHAVEITSPPDYMRKISRYLESVVEQGGKSPVINNGSGTDSDSGDSLFITQKPVPAAKRSVRRRHSRHGSHLTSPSWEGANEDNSSSSASHSEDDEKKRAQRKKYRRRKLPKYNFPFLRSTQITHRKNIKLHNFAMAGFFKSVQELWQGCQTMEDRRSSLPTVDVEGEDISPLTEEDEEERSVDTDIKVVARKYLLARCKAKVQPPVSTQQKIMKGEKKQIQESKQAGRWKLLHEDPVKVSVDAQSSSVKDGDVRIGQKHQVGKGNMAAPSETPKRHPGELSDHDDVDASSTAGETILSECTPLDRDVCPTYDLSIEDQPGAGERPQPITSEVQCSKPRAKKRSHRAATPVEIIPSLSPLKENMSPDNNTARQANEEERGSPPSKGKKWENSREEDGREEMKGSDEAVAVGEPADDETRRKKKKRKKSRGEEMKRSDEDVAGGEPADDETRRKKKKRKKSRREDGGEECLFVAGDGMERIERGAEEDVVVAELVNGETEKKKRKKEKRTVNTKEASLDHMSAGQLEELSLNNSPAPPDGSCVKRKKRKKKFHNVGVEEEDGASVKLYDDEGKTPALCIDEGINASPTPDKSQKTTEEVVKKRSKNISAAQSDDSVSVEEKKKAASFLVADAEENSSHTHSPSAAAAAGVSADIVELVESHHLVRKKKRKKEKYSEEVACQYAYPKAGEAGRKKKKKQQQDESQLATPLESLGSAADAGYTDEEMVVVRKKRKDVHMKTQLSSPVETHTTERSCDEETPNVLPTPQPGYQTVNSLSDKKKKKHLVDISFEEDPLTAEFELSKKKGGKKEERKTTPSVTPGSPRTSVMSRSHIETSSSDKIRKKKVKRSLMNLEEDFLSGCSDQFD
ncbi:uncharacterized protein ACBR49_010396 [Aulostomus maculatus]